MRTEAAVLAGVLVLLGGCLGGLGGIGDSADGTTHEVTTDGEAMADGDPTTTGESQTGGTTGDSTATDCGRATDTGSTTTGGDTQEAGTGTTTLPTTTDVERNVTATFAVPDCEDVTVTLMVADEQEERERGLMYRQSLPDRTGMVFVYDDAAPRTFWMKNTYVPLDIIFVAANGTVLNVEHAQAQPHASDSEVDRYSSDGDAKYVVELRRGLANRTGVGPETELIFNGTPPEAGPDTPDADG